MRIRLARPGMMAARAQFPQEISIPACEERSLIMGFAAIAVRNMALVITEPWKQMRVRKLPSFFELLSWGSLLRALESDVAIG